MSGNMDPVKKQKIHIAGLTRAELEEFVTSLGEPRYRAVQIFKAVHERRLLSFDEITDLPKEFRTKLDHRRAQ